MRVAVSKPRMQKILNFAADPKKRSAAARLLNNDAQGVVRIAKEIAHNEFHEDRDEGRRPEPNQGKPHYVDSFKISPATVESLQRMTVQWGNAHPAANIIEHGARPHKIVAGMQGSGTGPAISQGRLIFPYKEGASRTNTPGGPPGNWPANFGTGAKRARVKAVNHPGSPAFHIMRRAIRTYKRRNR
jgi:hypothetical protein